MLGRSGSVLAAAVAAAAAAASAMVAAWAPVELWGLPLTSGRATGGGAAKAAAMLKLGREVAGCVAACCLVGLPPPLDTAHSPTMELVLRGACGG